MVIRHCDDVNKNKGVIANLSSKSAPREHLDGGSRWSLTHHAGFTDPGKQTYKSRQALKGQFIVSSLLNFLAMLSPDESGRSLSIQ